MDQPTLPTITAFERRPIAAGAGEARPAYQRAFAAQLAVFTGAAT